MDGFNPLDIQNQFERSEKGSRDSSSKDNGKRNVITQTKVTEGNKINSITSKKINKITDMNKSKNYSHDVKNQKLSGFEDLIRK